MWHLIFRYYNKPKIQMLQGFFIIYVCYWKFVKSQQINESTCDLDDSANLKQLIKGSKYFFTVSLNATKGLTQEQIKSNCGNYGLVAGDMRHLDDYYSIVDHYRKNSEIKRIDYPIARTDKLVGPTKWGTWKYPEDKQDVSFTMWASMWVQPGYKRGEGGCADIRIIDSDDKRGVFALARDTPCSGIIQSNRKYGQFCSFAKDSLCYKQSYEEVNNTNRDKKLFKVGETSSRSYFTSYEQKNFFEAFKSCAVAGYKLMDFQFKEYTEFLKFHYKYIQDKDLHFATQFYTSAIMNNVSDLTYGWTWTSTNKTVNSVPMKNALWSVEWAKGWDHSQTGEDKCVSYWYGFPNKFLRLRVLPCSQPAFYFCYLENYILTDY